MRWQIADSDAVCIDVDLCPVANHGCLFINSRDKEFAPKSHPKPIRVVTAIHEKPFTKAFVKWCVSSQDDSEF